MSEIRRDMTVRSWGRRKSATRAAELKVVLVHGIFSDHRQLGVCQHGLAEHLDDAEFYYVDYDYHEPLVKNGDLLACALEHTFENGDNVFVIAHSMGGLVARIACLKRPLGFVRGVFLIATPNHGALRTSSLSVLAPMIRETVRVLWGIRSRKAGILDLTRVSEVMNKVMGSAESDGEIAKRIDYISIPGRYFHAQRGWFDHRLDGGRKTFFVAFGAAFDGLAPLLSIELSRAHDGIIEESSNCLIPDVGERKSEKGRSIRRVKRFAHGINQAKCEDVSYAHVVPDSAVELCHSEVKNDERVIRLVAEIIGASSLTAWLQDGRSKHDDVNVYLWNGDAHGW